jgi:hypothetical protein
MLIEIVVALIIIGLLLWLIQQLPLDPMIMTIIRVVLIIGVILWLLSFTGAYGHAGLGWCR